MQGNEYAIMNPFQHPDKEIGLVRPGDDKPELSPKVAKLLSESGAIRVYSADEKAAAEAAAEVAAEAEAQAKAAAEAEAKAKAEADAATKAAAAAEAKAKAAAKAAGGNGKPAGRGR